MIAASYTPPLRQHSETDFASRIRSHRRLAIELLRSSFRPRRRRYAFCLRGLEMRPGGRILLRREGHSHRYTAIALIGLAEEPPASQTYALQGHSPADVAHDLVNAARTASNLGDVALTAWAAHAVGVDPQPALARAAELNPVGAPHATVEVAWALAAFAQAGAGFDGLADQIADRLLAGYQTEGRMFPHTLGVGGLRAHVACFADLVYPVHALCLYGAGARRTDALDTARECVSHWASLQGPAGQWWWHYDMRTGRTLERFPVYTVHQLAMGPMALLAAERACGLDFTSHLETGARWVEAPPELDAGPLSLIDRRRRVIWRKVSRREPAKLTRRLQAAASRVHAGLRVPGMDRLFPPCAIDLESRPYEWGWLLYAWREDSLSRWETSAGGQPS